MDPPMRFSFLIVYKYFMIVQKISLIFRCPTHYNGKYKTILFVDLQGVFLDEKIPI